MELSLIRYQKCVINGRLPKIDIIPTPQSSSTPSYTPIEFIPKHHYYNTLLLVLVHPHDLNKSNEDVDKVQLKMN